MITRILTGLVLLGLGVTFIIYGGIPLLIATLIFALFATHEIFRMFEKIERKGYPILGHILVTLSILSTLHPVTSVWWSSVYVKVIILALLMFYFIEFLTKSPYIPKHPLMVTLRISTLMISTFPFFVLVREGHNGLLLYAFTCVIIWVVDISALFGGRHFGRHPLSSLSPKKTWEGSILGTFAGLIAASIFIHYATIPFEPFMALAILIAVTSQISDLHESLIKRTCGVKDSSHILPGHGGFYDRLDSALFVAPLVFFLFN